MATITLVTGGARSGKSGVAQEMAESLPGRRVFVATAPALDREMQERIQRHQDERRNNGWHTIEAERDLAGVLTADGQHEVMLIDCLTLWINNLMFAAGELDEAEVTAKCAELLAACRIRPGQVIFVTNEVGLGIVPDNPLARRYRDLVGRCNQVIAKAADEVILVTCGIPQVIKPLKMA